MPQITRTSIVVGVDDSDSSHTALGWAGAEAAARRCPLHIIHTWQIPLPPVAMGPAVMHPGEEQIQTAAQSVLDHAVGYVQGKFPNIDVLPDLVSGPPATVLVEASDSAAFVVVGKGSLDAFASFFLGSTSMQVVTHATCPVVVAVDPPDGEESGPDAGRLVVGIDGSEISVEATHVAFEFASRRSVGITLLHVWNASEYDFSGLSTASSFDFEEAHQGELRGMAQTVAGLQEQYPDVQVERRLAHGKPGKVLAEHSRGANMVVVGSRGRGGFSKLLLGSTSHTVVHRAHCPVLVVPPRKT